MRPKRRWLIQRARKWGVGVPLYVSPFDHLLNGSCQEFSKFWVVGGFEQKRLNWKLIYRPHHTRQPSTVVTQKCCRLVVVVVAVSNNHKTTFDHTIFEKPQSARAANRDKDNDMEHFGVWALSKSEAKKNTNSIVRWAALIHQHIEHPSPLPAHKHKHNFLLPLKVEAIWARFNALSTAAARASCVAFSLSKCCTTFFVLVSFFFLQLLNVADYRKRRKAGMLNCWRLFKLITIYCLEINELITNYICQPCNCFEAHL